MVEAVYIQLLLSSLLLLKIYIAGIYCQWKENVIGSVYLHVNIQQVWSELIVVVCINSFFVCSNTFISREVKNNKLMNKNVKSLSYWLLRAIKSLSIWISPFFHYQCFFNLLNINDSSRKTRTYIVSYLYKLSIFVCKVASSNSKLFIKDKLIWENLKKKNGQ